MDTETTDRMISTAIRARVPVIAVESPEEDRLLALFKVLGTNPRFPDERKVKDAVRPVIVWSITDGFTRIDNGEGLTGSTPEEIKDPIAALTWIRDWNAEKEKEPALFVMRDVQPYLESAQFARLVRDVAALFRVRMRNLILTGPTLEVPHYLENDVTLIQYPLPNVDELVILVETKISAMRELKIETDVNGDAREVAAALSGMTWSRGEQAMSLAIVHTGGFLVDEVIPHILRQKASIISASPALEYFHNQAEWGEIGGLDLLKGYAKRALVSMEPEAQDYGVDKRRGMLLTGLPGTGKSLTAKAIAGNRCPLLRLDVGALFGGLVGQSELQTRMALRIVEAIGRCILWIDEIEKALPEGGEGDGGTSQRVLGTILTWMEECTSPVYIVATANDITALRPELVRRFDCVFFVDTPNEQERQEILAIHLAKRGRDPAKFELEKIAEATDGFSGAELEQLVVEAITKAYLAGQEDVTHHDLVDEIAQVMPLTRTMPEKLSEMRKWADRARAASSKQESGRKPDSLHLEL